MIAILQLLFSAVGTTFIIYGLNLNVMTGVGIFLLTWAVMPIVGPRK
jgi:hypothetical protein